MPVPAVYRMGHALMGEGYERFQKCVDVELKNLLHFLSIVLCGSGGEKGTRTSAPKTLGEDGGGEGFSAWGEWGKSREDLC